MCELESNSLSKKKMIQLQRWLTFLICWSSPYMGVSCLHPVSAGICSSPPAHPNSQPLLGETLKDE